MEALAIPFSEIPIGTILAWYGSTTVSPPDKYRFCDGQIFTENQYPYLYQILVASGNQNLTIGLPAKQIRFPDLRGVFLRGYDPEREGRIDRDDSRKYVGHIQKDMIGQHTHNVTSQFPPLGYLNGGELRGGVSDVWLQRMNNPIQTNSGNGLGYETRPINANVAFIIRVEP